MTPAFPDPFFPLAPCLCVRTRYRKRPPGARDAFSEAFGTGEGLLRYGICVPCSKWLPGVRDAFSEAFGAKKQASTVRERYSVPETPFYGTE